MKGEKGQIHMADFALFSWIEKSCSMVVVMGNMLILPFFMNIKM